MIERKEIARLVAIFVAAVVILATALIAFGRELTISDVIVVAFFIAVAAIIAIRLAAFIMAARDL